MNGGGLRRTGRTTWRRLLWLLAVPFLLVLVVFTLSNRQLVAIGLWPTDASWQVPLSIAMLIAAAIAFIIGTALSRISDLRLRRRARKAEMEVLLLAEQLRALKAQQQLQPIPPPEA